jgi:hypothetical protein
MISGPCDPGTQDVEAYDEGILGFLGNLGQVLVDFFGWA